MVKESLKHLSALRDIEHLEGVRLLRKSVRDVVVSCVDQLSRGYTNKSEQELRALCATLRANVELYDQITGNTERIKALEDILVKDTDNSA